MPFRRLSVAALAILALGAQIAHAKPCRDDKGKFAKCEAPQKPKPCRDKKGKFTKCPPAISGTGPTTGSAPSATAPHNVTDGKIPSASENHPQ
ncbi:hypothetical protein [Gluconobacter kanchanaburiensis]|uniref:Uncharacterized protein n=1 Tax=Gluconobacter kanchanaburiensis NBRC 103587 TaxID=1307948 RepID=A0A511B5Y3_9PROT|nr:hypothetical protein [Gluconobacter kanchanaburiensis]MBF0861475.1 hypothetical protein [Gluconobacter kanchanaburiensis]GBR68365.1 hypothetical protein AA103587_0770 [Gluconobacter kanchanaburiensis NBRC 103587]GEK95839.1 hypothetical protein GKA01_10360 [Gluconobacter kanchanaburiensis NBRC 103587]